MEYQPYLLFELNQQRYGVKAQLVQEIFLLPEIVVVAESFNDVIGVVNLRGIILPIINLSLRLKQPTHSYSLQDSIIVLSHQNQSVGVLVNQVCEVQAIAETSISSDFTDSYWVRQSSERTVMGVAQVGADLVTLLDATAFTKVGREDPSSTDTGDEPCRSNPLTEAASSGLKSAALFFQDATAEQRQVLRQRAENLRYRPEEDNFTDLQSFAVVSLQGEYFAFGVDLIREFTEISTVTPIPCCPPHIIGNVNLRGEILTLVDVRQSLNLQPKPLEQAPQRQKAVVVQHHQLVAGIAVDEVFDVVYVHPSEIRAVPSAAHAGTDEYLRGVVAYQNTMMSILDLPKILTDGSLTVDETV